MQATGVSEAVQLQQPHSPQRPVEPRETREYKAAMELELWKEQQESLFEKQVSTVQITIAVTTFH